MTPDTPRVRRDILIEAQRIAQRIDEVEDQLEVYHQRDLPAFNAWFAGRFEGERADLSALERDLARVVQRHNAIVGLAKSHELSMEHAYRMVLEEEQAYARGNPATRRHIREERARRDQRLREDLEREVRERLHVLPPPARADTLTDDADVKVTYRKLVRRLHPDVRGNVSCANELRWQRRVWTLLQAAYENGDQRTLADLYRVTLLRQMDFGELTVDDAREALAWLTRELEALASERARLAGRPAWGFTHAGSTDALATRVREEFRLDAAAVRAEIDEITGQHEYLALLARGGVPVDARPRRARRKTREVPANQLSLFE